MKKSTTVFARHLALCCLALFSLVGRASAQERWATSVIGFSTQYSTSSWSAGKALGEPNVYPKHQDNNEAWSPSTQAAEREFLVLGFNNPSPVNYVRIYETFNPGAIDTVYVRNAQTGQFNAVFTTRALGTETQAVINTVVFPRTTYPVDAVRLAMNSKGVSGYNQIDAVAIGDDPTVRPPDRQFARHVLGYSSEYQEGRWNAVQVLGWPNVYPLFGTNSAAWASRTQDGGREYLELGYDYAIPINFIEIYETDNPGAVDSVFARNPNTGRWDLLWSGTAAPMVDKNRLLTLRFPTTLYDVREIRVAVNSPAVPGHNEIDAVIMGFDRTTAADRPNDGLPADLQLSGAYPNPFNPQAQFTVTLATTAQVRVELYDMLGRRVALLHDGTLVGGQAHSFTIDGSGLPSGVYHYRATGVGQASSRSVVLLK